MFRTNVTRCGARGGRLGAVLTAVSIAAAASMGGDPALAVAPENVYVEDFTTTTFMDPVNTTAVWDTIAGHVTVEPFDPTILATRDTQGLASDVAIQGNYAFVADHSAGIVVFDITEPSNPVQIGSLATPHNAWDIEVSGPLAVVTNEDAGLLLLDVSNPSNPQLVASNDTVPGKAVRVDLSGDYAFVAHYDQGLVVFDTSDPFNPTVVGGYNTPSASNDVVVEGDLAYVADGGSGLQILDVSVPTNPSPIGTYDTDGSAQTVAIAGNVAYVADALGGLVILDVTDPSMPALLGTVAMSPNVADVVHVSGDLAYVSVLGNSGDRGLLLFDVTDPSSPALLEAVEVPDIPRGFAIEGDVVYLGGYTAGLHVVEMSEVLDIPILVGTYSAGSAILDEVAISGDHAFLADRASGMHVLDISDPTAPTPVGTFASSSSYGIEVDGDLAYLADRTEGLKVLDISDPANPTLLGTYACNAYGLDIDGDYAFVAASSSFLILDVSDPTNPTLVGSQPAQSGARDVTVERYYAYVADDDAGLRIFNTFDPSTPVLIATYDTPGQAADVALSGDYAFIADQTGIQIVDVSSPGSPTFAGAWYTMYQPTGIEISGNEAFVGNNNGGLQVLDISDPTTPIEVGVFEFFGNAMGVAAAGDRVIVASGLSAQVIHVRQRDQSSSSAIARSLEFTGGGETVPRIRIASVVEQGGIAWEIAGYGTWGPIASDGTWARVPFPAPGAVWRANLFWTPGGQLPAVSELALEWLTEYAPITSVEDVPEDQGGWLRLGFCRSGYDFLWEPTHPVTGYGVYRRVDDPLLRARVENASVPANVRRDGLASFGTERVRHVDDRAFVLGETSRGSGTGLPAGIWENVAFLPAVQQDDYLSLLPAVGDSTGSGTPWSVFVVTTHTTNPSIWYISEPDSGYAVDNLPPAPPANLAFAGPETLEWDPADEGDFAYHSVYGSGSLVFDGSATLLGHALEPTFDVTGAAFPVYHVTSSDDADNASDPASLSNPALDAPEPGSVPIAHALHAARPNPLRASTSISFDLPEAARVRVAIYDAAGRRVHVLADDAYASGTHGLVWDATDATGRSVAPGVYFARLRAGAFSASRRLVVVR